MKPSELNLDPEKLFYSIGEVADIFGVNASLIRFWEKEFSIIKPLKNNKGNRMFTKEDVLNIGRIYELVKEKGFTLEGARQKLKEKDVPSSQNQELLSQLQGIRKGLIQLRDML